MMFALLLACLPPSAEPAQADPAPEAAPATQEAPAAEGLEWVILDPKGAPLSEQLAQHAAKAHEAGRLPVAYLGARWCAPCKVFKKQRNAPEIQAALAGVTLLEIDVDPWMSQLGDAGVKVAAIPHWFPLDAQGKPTGPGVSGDAWKDLSPGAMAPTLNTLKAHPKGSQIQAPGEVTPDARSTD